MLDCGLFLFGSKNSTLMFAVSWVKVLLVLHLKEQLLD
jgi:hypothetical protein